MSGSAASEEEEYVDALGVITALERTCELEAKLRQAIQDTHPLTTTLDWDFNAADREREALLAISEQLEYLEDKLREYRFLEPAELENKAVLLGQLDSVRRELVEVVERFVPHVLFGKEVVREVMAFAQVSDDSSGEEVEEGSEEELLGGGSGGLHSLHSRGASGSQGGFASEFETDHDELAGRAQHAQRAQRGDAYDAEQDPALIPAVRRSGAQHRPPRYPTHAHGKEAAGGGGRQPGASPKRPSSHQPAASTSPTSLHQQHQQQLAYLQQQQSPTRSAFLQHQHRELSSEQQARCGPGGHPLGAKAVPGAASNRTSPGSAAAAAAAAVVGTGGQARRGAEAEAAPRPQPGSRSGSSAGNTDSYSFSAQPAGPAPAHPVAPPSSYAPSDGAPSSRQSPHSARTASGTAPPAAAAPPPAAAAGGSRPTGSRPNGSRTFLLSKLNRAQGRYGDSAGSARFGAYTRVSDEDIYGALEERGHVRPASITNPSPRQYGGFVKIADRLSQGEEAAAPVPGPTSQRSPMPPRIYGESPDGWEAGAEIQPAGHAASLCLDPPALPRPDRGLREQLSVRSTPVRVVSPPRERLHLAYSSGGAGVVGRPARGSPRGGAGAGAGRLVGRLTNLLLTGAAAAVAVVVAQHAGPLVVQKGQEVAGQVGRKVQEQRQQLAVRRQAGQQRRREAAAARQREQAPALPWQQGGRMADLPQRPSGVRMADLPQRPGTAAAPGRMADRRPTAPPPRQQAPQAGPPRQQGAADPLPAFLANAAAGVPGAPPGRHSATGTAGGAHGSRAGPRQPSQLFPAMPPPDVSASMG